MLPTVKVAILVLEVPSIVESPIVAKAAACAMTSGMAREAGDWKSTF